MKATDHPTFVAYATLPDGAVRRLEVVASCQACALCLAFSITPTAVAMSARLAEQPARDALLQLDRRAS